MCEFVCACMSFPLQEFFIFFGLMLCCLLAIRDLTRTMLKHKKCRIRDKFQPCAFATSEPTSQNGFCRRDLMLFGLSSSFSLIFPTLGNLHLFTFFLFFFVKARLCVCFYFRFFVHFEKTKH